MSGQWSKAWSFFERSLAIRQEIGDVEGIANAHNNLGTLAQDQGKSELAEKQIVALIAYLQRLGTDITKPEELAVEEEVGPSGETEEPVAPDAATDMPEEAS